MIIRAYGLSNYTVLNITGCKFINNTSIGDNLNLAGYGNATVKNCDFINNTAIAEVAVYLFLMFII